MEVIEVCEWKIHPRYRGTVQQRLQPHEESSRGWEMSVTQNFLLHRERLSLQRCNRRPRFGLRTVKGVASSSSSSSIRRYTYLSIASSQGLLQGTFTHIGTYISIYIYLIDSTACSARRWFPTLRGKPQTLPDRQTTSYRHLADFAPVGNQSGKKAHSYLLRVATKKENNDDECASRASVSISGAFPSGNTMEQCRTLEKVLEICTANWYLVQSIWEEYNE